MSGNSAQQTLDRVAQRNPDQPEYLQAATEILEDVGDLVESTPEYRARGVLDRLLEPDRSITFRVSWEDDAGHPRTNRGFRVQTCNVLGPYKGGLRFHPTVNLSILKFLGLEQTLKNSLTGLPIGSAKGGADFQPSDHSESEVRRFCQAFMTELVPHIGPETDVPAGDIGVGSREIGYLFGQYRRLRRSFDGGLTGKPVDFGGSAMRTEATGYGVVYFAEAALRRAGEDFGGRRCLVSGAGNVALHCAEKLLDRDCTVLTLSDSGGTLLAESGISFEDIEWLRNGHGRLRDLAETAGYDYQGDSRPWRHDGDLAFPSATENEIDANAAERLVEGGCRWVVEGANMPCDREAIGIFRDAGVRVCPGKAANAGGVVVSALEMAQNASFRRWEADRVHELLKEAMCGIHARCCEHLDDDRPDYIRAANRAGFIRVADAMVAQGI